MEITRNMLKRSLPILLAVAVFVSACGGSEPTPPPVSQVDIQNTAIAAANTIVAMTAQAQPTATPLPPTEMASPTPLPTFTPELVLVPTLAVPTLVPTLSGDPCDRILNVAEAGINVVAKNIRVENTTTGTANFGLTLTQPNSFGQCGYLSGFNNVLKKGNKVKLVIPAGCWYVWAFIDKPNGVRSTAEAPIHCLGDSRKGTELLRIVIKDSTITWVGP